MIEEVRDECIKAILNYIQGICKGYLGRKQFKFSRLAEARAPKLGSKPGHHRAKGLGMGNFFAARECTA